MKDLSSMIPSSLERVPAHTSDAINRQIRRDIEDRLDYYADHPDEIEARLEELAHEWDIERAIEANAATLAFTGVVLGAVADRRWLILPAAVTAFLLQHAVQGWCPPVPVLRRLGFRTAHEIERERYALKALRGDFNEVQQAENKVIAVLRAVYGTLKRGSRA
jgi:hypothetical protein